MRKAIEVEYWVVDSDGSLTTPGELIDLSEYIDEEFVDPMLELKTPPCDSFDHLKRTFLQQLDELLDAAAARDKHLVPLGTPINGAPIDQRPGERTRIQKSVIGEEFQFANYCAGTHLHFEKENVTDQLNVLIALDPALALLNSSPYFEGEPLANGARSYLYRKKCYDKFPKHGQLWEYVETVAEWERRLEECFQEFASAAMDAGVNESAIHSNFSEDTVVWTPVRLREAMPTVEWRSPDTALPSQVLALVKRIDQIMCQVSDTVVTVDGDQGRVSPDEITIPEFSAVKSFTDAAIHRGLDSPEVREYVERMGFDLSEFDPFSAAISGKSHVTIPEARQIRLTSGRRMRQDVKSMLNSQSH